jgi:selenoprotein W-related protein
VSLTAEILKAYETHITSLDLVPSSGGVFEVDVDGDRIFSKQVTNRYPAAMEIKKLIEAKLKG